MTYLTTVIDDSRKGKHCAHVARQSLHELPSIMFLRAGNNLHKIKNEDRDKRMSKLNQRGTDLEELSGTHFHHGFINIG
jgi:phage-related protein